MKKLLILIAAISVLFSLGYSQSEGGDGGKNEDQVKQRRAGLEELMDNMPSDVKAQVQNAVQKAEAAQKQIREMKGSGKDEEEVEAAIEQKRTQARERLQEAIDNLDKMGEEAKGELKKTCEQIQDRLQERKAEFEQKRAQVQERKGQDE